MKIFHKIHLWMALPFGIVMTIVCITGALLIIEKPVTTLIEPNFYETKVEEPAPQPAPQRTCTGDCQNCKTGCGGSTAEASPARSEMAEETEKASQTGMAERHGKAEKGRKGGKQKKLPFFENTLKLHRWLLDAPQTKGERTLGKTIVGISIVLFVLDLLTGLVIWWPRKKKSLRNRLKVEFGKGTAHFLHDCHVSLGFWTMAILLLIALTGLTWSFPVWKDAFTGLLGTFVEEKEIHGLIFQLHTGTWGGWVSQTIYFICCIIGASLPLTGYYLWLKTKHKHKKKK